MVLRHSLQVFDGFNVFFELLIDLVLLHMYFEQFEFCLFIFHDDHVLACFGECAFELFRVDPLVYVLCDVGIREELVDVKSFLCIYFHATIKYNVNFVFMRGINQSIFVSFAFFDHFIDVLILKVRHLAFDRNAQNNPKAPDVSPQRIHCAYDSLWWNPTVLSGEV